MKHVLLQEQQQGRVTYCPVGRWLTVGRSGQRCDVVCKDKHVSREHCRIKALPSGGLEIVDQSQFGTSIAGQKLTGPGTALPGQTIVLGTSYTLRVIGMLDADASHADELEPVPPRRLGPHAILLREVGRGGMGVVYEAWDEKGQRRCAVKWLREGGRADAERIERFQREALLQGRLADYPGIVTIYDLGVLFGSGQLYCVMEYVDGESLLEKMRRGVERAEAVRVVARAAHAVHYAHEHDVLHRDIKPGNILVSNDGRVRLTDFGIARALDDGGGKTMTGIMLGTPGYMAPEQIRDAKSVGRGADIYALGATVFSALTGKLPIKGKSMREALVRSMEGTVPPRMSKYVEVDPVLDAAVQRALEFEPADRWPTAESFALELERWLKHNDPAARVSLSGPGA
ncbi:MAG: FHA domain-containing serine/threonine-protein kinase [Planctomycetota bacterium]